MIESNNSFSKLGKICREKIQDKITKPEVDYIESKIEINEID